VIDTGVCRRFFCLILLIGILGALGPVSTSGQFTDEHDGTGIMSAAEKFNSGGGFPKNAVAYDDADQDGEYDSSETAYEPADLENLVDSSVHLRFHSSANNIRLKNSDSTIDVASISQEASIRFETGALDWSTDGDLTITGTELKKTDSVTLSSSNGDVIASGIDTSKGPSPSSIRISAARNDVDISNANLQASNSIQVFATSGKIDISGATCTAPTEQLADSTSRTLDC
jgi:hypothetical protein